MILISLTLETWNVQLLQLESIENPCIIFHSKNFHGLSIHYPVYIRLTGNA